MGQRYILTRMLNNLKNHYAQRGDLVNAARVVERLLVLNPDNWLEVRNLGLIYGQIGRKHQAIALLEQYSTRIHQPPTQHRCASISTRSSPMCRV